MITRPRSSLGLARPLMAPAIEVQRRQQAERGEDEHGRDETGNYVPHGEFTGKIACCACRRSM